MDRPKMTAWACNAKAVRSITSSHRAIRSAGLALQGRSTPDEGEKVPMSTITTKDGVEIFYKDWGSKDAQPIVFHHGWPLSADDWDPQMLFFRSKGYRVVALDRRGHGRSSQA